MEKQWLRLDRVLPIALFIALAILPRFVGSYWLHTLLYMLWIMYLCTAWNISSLPGLFSILPSLFLGCGAYISTIMWLFWGISPWIGLFAGAATGAIVALIVGWLSFRYKLPMITFAVFTLIICFVAEFIMLSVPIMGSTEGIALMYSGTNPAYFQFESKLPFYYIIFAFNIGAIFLVRYILNSKIGIYFRAIHDNERVAAAAGVNVTRYKIIALVISGALTAVGGAFWAQYYRFISPHTFSPHFGIVLILLTVIGGSRTLWGPVLGSVILVPLGEVLKTQFGEYFPGLNLIIYGVIIIAVLLTLRTGILPYLAERQQKRKAALAATSHSPGKG